MSLVPTLCRMMVIGMLETESEIGIGIEDPGTSIAVVEVRQGTLEEAGEEDPQPTEAEIEEEEDKGSTTGVRSTTEEEEEEVVEEGLTGAVPTSEDEGHPEDSEEVPQWASMEVPRDGEVLHLGTNR